MVQRIKMAASAMITMITTYCQTSRKYGYSFLNRSFILQIRISQHRISGLSPFCLRKHSRQRLHLGKDESQVFGVDALTAAGLHEGLVRDCEIRFR